MKKIDNDVMADLYCQHVRVPNIVQESIGELFDLLEFTIDEVMTDVPQKPEGEPYTKADYEEFYAKTSYTLDTLIYYNKFARDLEKLTHPFMIEDNMSDEEILARFTPEYIAKGLEYMQDFVRERQKKWEEKNGEPYPFSYEDMK